ncbi:hypothetical protein GWK47_018095 [Chionoecetes opilio]|uniref:Uncharacterized protein n=1 Tax=Chionoecetes opilio TaxID=41210 RepID=A0A8J4XRC5_CHIOP|nr:hypothetical protein GWK47_018095 [Chionoecetes opilio]
MGVGGGALRETQPRPGAGHSQARCRPQARPGAGHKPGQAQATSQARRRPQARPGAGHKPGQYQKKQLEERYGDCIYIAEEKGLDDSNNERENGQHPQITLQQHKPEDDEESQKRAITETAARLIKAMFLVDSLYQMGFCSSYAEMQWFEINAANCAALDMLGAIGALMDGTGLKDILREVYGEAALGHMMTGKSLQRPFRGHLLVDKCLNRMVVSEMADDDPGFAAMVEESEATYTALVNGGMTLDTVLASETLGKIYEELRAKKMELSARSKTSQLWLNYQGLLEDCGLCQLEDCGLCQLEDCGLCQLEDCGLCQLEDCGLCQLEDCGLCQLEDCGLCQLEDCNNPHNSTG